MVKDHQRWDGCPEDKVSSTLYNPTSDAFDRRLALFIEPMLDL